MSGHTCDKCGGMFFLGMEHDRARCLIAQLKAVKAQRDRYATALREWVKWAAKSDTHLKGMAQIAALHGFPYQGENYADVLDESIAALKEDGE